MRIALTGRLRPIAVLAALAGTLALSGCGGGSGAVNNPNPPTEPPVSQMIILPAGILTAYSGVPATFQIFGGRPPYLVTSNNPAVLPVPFNVSGDTIVMVANPVASSVNVDITVTDTSGQFAVGNALVQPAPLFENGLTVTPSSSNCGINVCDGDTAGVLAVATGVGGAPLPGRQIRFDVVFGPFGILTSNPAAPIAATLTVVTDAFGAAAVQIQATANATTQQAQIRATDLTTGQQQVANFVVERKTSTDNLSVIPPTATVTTFFNDSCSSGFNIDYYIFGGTPPYTVTPSFPQAIGIAPTTVGASGGFFRATTNGFCVNPLTFSIVDAAGKTTTAQLINVPGTEDPPSPPTPTPPSALLATPTSLVRAGAGSCTGQTFLFVITGGTRNYNVSSSTPPASVSQQPNAGGQTLVGGMLDSGGVYTFVVVDSGNPQQTRTFTVNCTP